MKQALITGGAKGIGFAIASALVAADYKTTLMGRDEETLKNAATLLKCEFLPCDITNETQVKTAFKHIETLDVLVNNAGIALSAPFNKTTPEMLTQMLNVNLMGVFHITQAALPKMSNGRIINIASTAGLKGYAYVSGYVASKHALIGLTKALALELASKNITVNAICPGFTRTQMLEQSLQNIIEKTGRTREEALSELTKHNPQKRLIEPEEVANTVLWLLSEQARSITGQAISVSGGEI